MKRNFENMGIGNMVTVLDRMNPRGNFKKLNEKTIAVKGIEPQYIKYPEGYYYNPENGITNKHNTFWGMYETFEVVVQK